MSQSLDIEALKRRNARLKQRLYACLMARLTDQRKLALLRRRRDHIRDWLCEEETYALADQQHLDTHAAERVYWRHGCQTALHDIITLLTTEPQTAHNAVASGQCFEGDPDEPCCPAD